MKIIILALLCSLAGPYLISPRPKSSKMKTDLSLSSKERATRSLAREIQDRNYRAASRAHRYLARPQSEPYSIVDTGADMTIVGKGWKIIKDHHKNILVNGVPCPVVDAKAVFYDPLAEGPRRLMKIVFYGVPYDKKSKETCVAPQDMQWAGYGVDTVPPHHGGKCHIVGRDWVLPLLTDGTITFFIHREPRDKDKGLSTFALNSVLPFKASDYIHNKVLGLAENLDPNEDPAELDRKAEDLIYLVDKSGEPLYAAPEEWDEFHSGIKCQRRYVWDPEGHNWKQYQLVEWQRRLGGIPEETVKKTFMATTQLVPSVRHENELIPKNAQGHRFPMLSVRRLRETVYCDVVPFRSNPKQTKDDNILMFYGDKSKICAVYYLGKNTSSASVMKHVWEFTRDYGAPETLASDFANNLAAGEAWKRWGAYTQAHITPCEANKHQQNKVERAWQQVQARVDHYMQTYAVPHSCYVDCVMHMVDCINHTARASLNWKTPMNALTGETPDISVFRFRFWEEVWYLKTPYVSQKEKEWIKGRFLGIAWATGDHMCYKVAPIDGYKRPVERALVLPRHPDENAPRQLLRNTSDYFFPTPKVKKTPVEGRGKRKRDESNSLQPENSDPKELIFPDGATPVEDQVREAWLQRTKQQQDYENQLLLPTETAQEDPDAVATIMKHWSKTDPQGRRYLVFNVEDIHGRKHKCALSDLKADSPITLAKYVKEREKSFQEAGFKDLRDWASKTLKVHEKRLQLTRDLRDKLGIDAGPEVLQASRITGSTTRRRREVKPAPRRTKTGGKQKKSNSPNRRSSSPMGTFKYGVYIPKNTTEALELDKRNGNSLWRDAIHKELGAIMKMKTFRVLTEMEKKKFNRKESSFAPVRCIYDVKVSLPMTFGSSLCELSLNMPQG